MDYSVLDIFSKDKFILRSEARKLQFPFIRYNGSNYEELVSFITSFSPNTIVPAPEKLKIGELYTFSGKKFQFRHVPIGNLRYAIASNPFIVLPEGDCLPLALEYQQAVDYLKENRHHKLFAYEDILATYKYNPEHTSFMMYDRSHPKGVVLDELPKFIDWYIGGDDDANHLWSCFKVVYKTALHMVDARPDFEDLVDIIDGERYAINQSLYVQGRPIMFNVNWEDNARRKALKHTCHHIHDLKSFIGALYKIIYEDTKGASQSPKESLGEFAGESIVRIIEELHHYYGTGQKSSAPMDSDWPFTIDQIIQMYLQHNLGPQEPEDYSQLQQGILIDFHDYLVKIKESIREKMKIIGTLCQDDYGNIYCGKALVDQRYRCYCGCECVITSYSRNVNDELPQFPYYTDRLYRVALNRTGIISRDEEGTLYLDKYVLRDSAANQLGKEAQVRGIRPFFIPRGEYLGEVVDYVLSNDVRIKTPTSVVETPGQGDNPTYSLPRGDEWKKCPTYKIADKQHYEKTVLGRSRAVAPEQVESLYNALVIVECIDNDENVLFALAVRLTGRKLMEEPIPLIEWKGENAELDYLIFRLTPENQKPDYAISRNFFDGYDHRGAARRAIAGKVRPSIINKLDEILPPKVRPKY